MLLVLLWRNFVRRGICLQWLLSIEGLIPQIYSSSILKTFITHCLWQWVILWRKRKSLWSLNENALLVRRRRSQVLQTSKERIFGNSVWRLYIYISCRNELELRNWLLFLPLASTNISRESLRWTSLSSNWSIYTLLLYFTSVNIWLIYLRK